MKKKIIAGIVILVLVIAVISLFPRKIKFQENLPVCTQDGATATAEFDVVLWKYWYMPDVMRGTVVIDGITYEHVEYKKQSESRSFLFAVPADDALVRHDNMLYVSLYGKEFDNIILSFTGDSESYIGPAESVEEAEQILDRVINDGW